MVSIEVLIFLKGCEIQFNIRIEVQGRGKQIHDHAESCNTMIDQAERLTLYLVVARAM